MPIANDNAPAGAPSRTDKILAVALAVRPAVKHILEAIEQIEALNAQGPESQPSETRSDPGVTLLTFPPAKKVQILKAIACATGLSASQAKEHIENLPVTLRALLSDSALADELRALGASVECSGPGAPAPAPSAAIPKALGDYLDQQQRHALNLQDMLERLDADGELPACLGIAARAAQDLNEALDANSIRHVLKGERS